MSGKIKWITVFERDDWISETIFIDYLYNFLVEEGHRAERVTLKRIDVLMHPSNEDKIKELVRAFVSGWEAKNNWEERKLPTIRSNYEE